MENKNRTQHPAEPFVRRHRTFFVGLFILVPLIAMPLLFVFTLLKNDMLQKYNTLYVVYENSQGLKSGSYVTMSGNTIGYVKGVDLIREREVCVRFDIRGEFRRIVKKDTRARLKQRGFVGDWEIELTGGSESALEILDGDTLRTEKTYTMDGVIEMAIGLMDSAMILINELNIAAREINAGEGTMGMLLRDDTLYRHIRGMGSNALAITSEVRKLAAASHGSLGKADSLMITLTGVGANVGAGGASLIDSLMSVVTMANKVFDDIRPILQNLKTVSDDAPDLMKKLKEELDEAELMMRSLQNSWIFRKATGAEAPKNPGLTDSP